MQKYNKVLVSIGNKDFNSYGNVGDWLYIANENDTRRYTFS